VYHKCVIIKWKLLHSVSMVDLQAPTALRVSVKRSAMYTISAMKPFHCIDWQTAVLLRIRCWLVWL